MIPATGICKHCLRRVHAGPGQAHQELQLIDTLSVGVGRIQRNFDPCSGRSNPGARLQIGDAQANPIFYLAFVDSKLDAPKSLLSEVHRFYFEPQYPEFSARTMEPIEPFTSVFEGLELRDGWRDSHRPVCRAH